MTSGERLPTWSTSDLNGWEAVTLANEAVEVTVIPAKGGDIYSLVDRASGVDVLAKTPAGLQRPGEAVAGDDVIEFLHNYEGGWQTLFPSAGDACSYRGRDIPFHGEVALKSWQWEPSEETQSVRLRVDCETVPLTLERVITLPDDTGTVRIEDTVVNRGGDPCDFVLGHHCAFGAPLVRPGATVEIDEATVFSVDEYWDDTATIRRGQRTRWPFVTGRDGRQIDLREIEAPDRETQDDVYMTDLRAGAASIWNRELGLKLSLEWDVHVFRWIVLWQLFGAEKTGTLAGAYLIGLEPWTSRRSLEQAVVERSALTVDGHDTFRTTLAVRLARS